MPDYTQQKWYMRRGIEKLGPYDWTTLCNLVERGEVHRHDLLAHKQLKRWTRADELPELIDMFLSVEEAARDRAAREMEPVVPPSTQVMTFTVSAIDPESGEVSSVDIVAGSLPEARQQVAVTGMRIQSVKLKSISSAPVSTEGYSFAAAPPPRHRPPPHPASAMPIATRGPVCPYCETKLIPPGGGFANASEFVTCIFLLFAVLFIGGVIYYYWANSKPYCPACKRRVSA